MDNLGGSNRVDEFVVLACVPSDLDKAYDKMAIEGYKVTINKAKGDDGSLGFVVAMKTDEGETETLVAYLFDSKGAAKKFYEANKASGETILRDGKWVYSGTEDAIDDFID